MRCISVISPHFPSPKEQVSFCKSVCYDNNNNNNNNSRFIRRVEITRVMSVSVQKQGVTKREKTAEYKESKKRVHRATKR